ncbi:protein SAAL1 isoform X2 [Zophobas morio]|uniref:protein SAAL1 isoform X2 n=1 Tax=Zophobas morio TaxID=2755281 RepID=UPI003083784C
MESDDTTSLEATNPSTNITADEIDEETAKKLRGDAIGNTMYSEVFVLNTLIQFSDLKWSEEVENNLCFLWDMTEDTDVCKYLFQASYPKLACSAIDNYTEPRFIEIVVGIFANLLCSKCEKNVTEEEIKTVLNLLSSNDPYILIQVMRFIHAASFLVDKWEFFEEEHLDRFDFILASSTNKELLAIALKALVSITEGMKIKVDILKGGLLGAVVAGYRTLRDDCEDFEVFEEKLVRCYQNLPMKSRFCCIVM